MIKLYAQIDGDGVCTCVGTPKTDIEVVDYSCVGKRYVDGTWEDVPLESEPYQPTNAEVAQLLSDLQADLVIAGVI